MQSNRRDFLKGCCAAAVAAGTPPALAWFDPLALSGQKSAANGDILIYLFLSGGMDSLHLVVPYGGPDRIAYENKRGSSLTIPVDRLRKINDRWGWHPRAGGERAQGVSSAPRWLQKLYQQNRLAIVQGCGMHVVNRSHFEAQRMIELGTPGNPNGSHLGWLTRYFNAATGLPQPTIAPAYGFGATLPTSMTGMSEAVGFDRADQFRVDGFHWPWNDSNSNLPGHAGAHTHIRHLWQGNSMLERAGRDAADALEYMRTIDFRLYHATHAPQGYKPAGGAEYPTSLFGVQLRNLAQMLKTDLRNGLVAVALNRGGWDTHENQGMPRPGVAEHYDLFGNSVEDLARSLDAFYTDLQATAYPNQPGLSFMDKVTVVVQSEFGRRFKANGSNGTDHGYGGVMLALGNKVRGGQMHGTFPGLDDNSLRDGQDVDVTTDFRQILSEALVKRLGLPAAKIGQVFPGFSYASSNVFMG